MPLILHHFHLFHRHRQPAYHIMVLTHIALNNCVVTSVQVAVFCCELIVMETLSPYMFV